MTTITQAQLAKWKITLNATGVSRIELDGKEVRHVRAVTISKTVGEVPTVTLTLLSGAIEIDAETQYGALGSPKAAPSNG